MSTFSDQMALDMAQTFLDPQGFGEAALFLPVDGGGASFAVSVVVGDPVSTTEGGDEGQAAKRVATLYCQKSVILAGILAITTVTRDSRRGDKITIATGANAGTWTIQGPPSEDMGDGAPMLATMPQLDAPGGKGARQVH